MRAGIDLGFKVNVQAKVMKDGKIVREYPMQHNLILDSGMEALATTYTSDVFVTAAVGNGTTPTERSSGGATVSAAGGTATATAGFFVDEVGDVDVGRLIYFPSAGIQATITGFISTTQVSISDVSVIGDEVVTVYNVKQTQLASYVVGSATYRDTGNAENGDDSTLTNGVDWLINRWRTFQFPIETGSVTYTEGGWTWEDVAVTNPTLFGRIVFATPVQVDLGEQLLLYVELNTWIDCTDKTIAALPITNLTVAAHSMVRPTTLYERYDGINSTGTSDHSGIFNSSGGVAEPSNSKLASAPYPVESQIYISISDDSTVITSDPIGLTGVTDARVVIEPEAYVASSYQLIFIAFFTGVSIDLTTNWYDMRLSNDGLNQAISCFRILFDAVQSKTLADTVQLIFTKSWSRDLS